MVPFEVQRLKQIMAFDERQLTNVTAIVKFMEEGMRLILPESVLSKYHFNIESPNILQWEWEKNECFAYKGMSRMGVIDGYECGVMYRIECWFESLGLKFESNVKSGHCQMHTRGHCRGQYKFNI
jgi:hypothetical protein